jgi:hypothetical protein
MTHNFPSLVNQLSNEVKSWPYDFPQSKDFVRPNLQGTLTGCLHVQDRYIFLTIEQLLMLHVLLQQTIVFFD